MINEAELIRVVQSVAIDQLFSSRPEALSSHNISTRRCDGTSHLRGNLSPPIYKASPTKPHSAALSFLGNTMGLIACACVCGHFSPTGRMGKYPNVHLPNWPLITEAAPVLDHVGGVDGDALGA